MPTEMDRVKQLLVNQGCSAKATKLKSPSCLTLLVLFLWSATKWDKPAKWEGSPLAQLVPLRGPLLYFQTIFGGNIDKDNINHPSESRNFFPKGYREFP